MRTEIPFELIGSDEMSREIEAQRRAGAEKLQAERRAAQDLEIAKMVQARLFPQMLPEFPTLDYAGVCTQALSVGGDYYDFLDLGQDRLGLVVGDISGKGIAAALLMANLQANLRSRTALAVESPEQFLVFSQPAVPRELHRQRIRHPVLCGVRQPMPVYALRQLRPSSRHSSARATARWKC